MLISCLTLIPAQSISNSAENLASTGQNILLSLDSNGRLANLVDSHDWSSIRTCVESTLPLTVWFNLTVFDENMNSINSFPICNAGAVGDKIVSVEYVCASMNSAYSVYVLRLQLSVVS
jgi:hypothetical protein